MSEESERIYVNWSLAKRMPYLFEGLTPMDPESNFAKVLMEEYKLIKDKYSERTVSQRKKITDYVEGFMAYKSKKGVRE